MTREGVKRGSSARNGGSRARAWASRTHRGFQYAAHIADRKDPTGPTTAALLDQTRLVDADVAFDRTTKCVSLPV